MNYLLLITIFNLSVQCVFSFGFIRELFFPRYPILHRVRNLNQGRNFDNSTVIFDFIGLVQSQGYPAEEHYLTTEDGYKLIIHRIPGSPKSLPQTGKPVILLQHGLFSSSDSWVLMGANNDLAFILADNGYDVWFSNVRGNSYCRSHVELTTLDAEFWNFSYHEIGFYDLPAIIDYCLYKTGQKNLIYIGHSMGTTLSYVLLSTKPNYNEKIKLVVSLAPVAMWKIRPNDFMYKILRSNADALIMFLDNNDIYDFFPQTDNNAKLIKAICDINPITQTACAAFFSSLAGTGCDRFNSSVLPYIARYFPAGGSVLTVNHYGQNIKQGAFQQFNYGYATNYKIYGRKRPPLYNVKKITAPVALIYSTNDPIVHPRNVMELSNKLSNVVELYKVPNDKFNHLDYIWAQNVKEILYYKILDIVMKY